MSVCQIMNYACSLQQREKKNKIKEEEEEEIG